MSKWIELPCRYYDNSVGDFEGLGMSVPDDQIEIHNTSINLRAIETFWPEGDRATNIDFISGKNAVVELPYEEIKKIVNETK